MQDKTIYLGDGSEVASDVLLCGTGWRNEFDFFPASEKHRLGLPEQLKDTDEQNEIRWSKLEASAETDLLKRYPNFVHIPPFAKSPTTKTPYRLYRGMAPVNDPSVVFLGQVHLANAFRSSECQALWAASYLQGQLDVPPQEEMEADVAYVVAWDRRRYPTQGHTGTFIPFEMMGYIDTLLEQLGLSSHRKPCWWADLTSPALAADFAGLLNEYRGKRAKSIPVGKKMD